MPSSACKTCADRKSTRLNSSHTIISYAVFCLKKKNKNATHRRSRDRRPPSPSRRRTRLSRAGTGTMLGLQLWRDDVNAKGCLFGFFLNNGAPPEFSPFPHPPPFHS